MWIRVCLGANRPHQELHAWTKNAADSEPGATLSFHVPSGHMYSYLWFNLSVQSRETVCFSGLCLALHMYQRMALPSRKRESTVSDTLQICFFFFFSLSQSLPERGRLFFWGYIFQLQIILQQRGLSHSGEIWLAKNSSPGC